jgi:hypothetical protein
MIEGRHLRDAARGVAVAAGLDEGTARFDLVVGAVEAVVKMALAEAREATEAEHAPCTVGNCERDAALCFDHSSRTNRETKARAERLLVAVNWALGEGLDPNDDSFNDVSRRAAAGAGSYWWRPHLRRIALGEALAKEVGR